MRIKHEKIYCSACGIELTARDDWEPDMRIDTATGEITHGRECSNCIALRENIRADETFFDIDIARDVGSYTPLAYAPLEDTE